MIKTIECDYCGDGRMIEQISSKDFGEGVDRITVTGLIGWRCTHCESEMVDGRQLEQNTERYEAAKPIRT